MDTARLPPPVTARARFDVLAGDKWLALRARWAQLKTRLRNAAHLTATSFTANEGIPARSPGFCDHRSAADPSGEEAKQGLEDESAVDVVIVENQFPTPYDPPVGSGKASLISPSEHDLNVEKPVYVDQNVPTSSSVSAAWNPYHSSSSRWRVWPFLMTFFAPQFKNDSAGEESYRREAWHSSTTLGLVSTLFFILNWVLGCSMLKQPLVLSDQILYYGLAPALTIPLPFLVYFKIPMRSPLIYQVYITCSVWIWAYNHLFFMYFCGFYRTPEDTSNCAGKDFSLAQYYISALPVLGLFALGQTRLASLIGASIAVILMGVLILPDRTMWIRHLINTILFQGALLYIHWTKEMAERHLFILRERVKDEYKKTQSAQVNERKMAESKRRLTSYIFHEVRVPLNTAMLAVQNMEASGMIAKDRSEQDIEFSALEGSLSMMSKVLNDVLDFNRMDVGKFESVARPYSFHTAIRSILVPLRLASKARGLELEMDLDPDIDDIARRAAHQALNETDEWIDEQISEEGEDAEGLVVGDEMRLRQIVTNLASNALKFTSHGKVRIVTKLVQPDSATILGEAINGAVRDSVDRHSLEGMSGDPPPLMKSDSYQPAVAGAGSRPALESIVVRVEVVDTGFGIRARDIKDDNLFSPYVQTEIGRSQGGKGSGLGLALVRHIVQLSGGRLGVKSKYGEGSTFWIELVLGVGRQALSLFNSSTSQDDPTTNPSEPPSLKEPVGRTLEDPVVVGIATSTGSSTPSEGRYIAAVAPPAQSDSALRTIMEQGGLVELVPRRHSRVLSKEDLPVSVAHVLASDVPSGIPFPESTTKSDPTTLMSPLSPSLSPSLLPPCSGITSIRTTTAAALLPTVPALVNNPRPPIDSPLEVLVVDDDPLTRKLFTRMLIRLGCTVHTAENGYFALQLLLGANMPTPASETTRFFNPPEAAPDVTSSPTPQAHFDVIFLDNQMPVFSGLYVVSQLRAAGRNDLVVGVTGNALRDDQEEYIQAGADHVLIKPVLERNIKSMLALGVDRRQRNTTNPQNIIPQPPDSIIS